MGAQGRWFSSHRRIPSRPVDGQLAGRQWKKPCHTGTIQSGCQSGGSAIAMAHGSQCGTWSSAFVSSLVHGGLVQIQSPSFGFQHAVNCSYSFLVFLCS
jgi:hypothetical protein